MTELFGGVHLERGSQAIVTETLRLEHDTGQVTAPSQSYLAYPGIRLIGRDLQVNLDNESGRITGVSYRFSGETNLRGQAERIEIASPELMHLQRVRYHTSCKPDNKAWSIHARKLDLDKVTGRGKARDVHLRIADIPVLYTPYLSFPIDDRRKSGFLVPMIGNSDQNGFDITLPYYWNIAPNMDATLFPRYMSKRGAMLGGEFRYLTPRDQGTISGQLIPSDSAYDNRSRGSLHIEQSGRFWQRWATSIDYNRVSDDDYLDDLGTSLDETSVRHLLQSGTLSYAGNGWSLTGLIQTYQTLDSSSSTYGRLPQVLLTLPRFDFGPGLNATLHTQYDYFHHDSLVNGHRFVLFPRLNWPLRRSYGHLIPSLGVHLSQYQLEDQEEGFPDAPSHAIPTFDLDGQLVFERPIKWLGSRALQTLEPRLFYLYTPYQDQSETPVFDSSELGFNYSNLFRTNRFTGLDRIGDANQLTLGLTSRTLGQSNGEEFLRASIGRMFYFADRRVQISDSEDIQPGSPYAGEIAAKLLDHWNGRVSLEWDPQATEEDAATDGTAWNKRTFELEYRNPNNDRLLNLAYRFNQDSDYEDTDLSFRWPISEGGTELVGRWLYSMKQQHTMEAIAGLEFGQCCWRLRLLGQYLINDRDSDTATGSTSVMVQLELAGLGRIGDSIGEFLAPRISGYQIN
ncbi:LPS-assembly protein LptD [Thiorhodovibrio winogradskyi]|uniref:LPS-assembly protein LptD n=1 Tax=Thiorhodovibrio winogradskyi TaxID=77007 RepID=UPI002E2E73C7|nr:LPS-assembly protein LptD [Thiorhodovibrio winogradskyi]